MKLLMNIIISSIAVLLSSYVLPGVTLEPDIVTILVVVLLLAVANSVVKPLLLLFTLPLTILTLGLFALVINALMVMLVDALVDGFAVSNFWWALLFSFVLSIISSVLGSLSK